MPTLPSRRTLFSLHRTALSCLLALGVGALGPATLPAQAWEKQGPLPSDQDLNGIFFTSPVRGFAVGDDQVFLETSDGGATWSQVPAVVRDPAFWEDPFYELTFVDADHGWVVGNNNGAWRTTDGGATWQQMTGFPAGSYTFLVFVTPQDGWVGGNGSVVRTRDGGLTWTVLTFYDEHGVIFGLDFWDTQRGAFSSNPLPSTTGYPAGIYLTSDGGDNWAQVYQGDTGQLLFLNATTILALGGGGLLKSTDLGQTWSTIPWPFSEGINNWWRFDASNLAAVGNLGSVYLSSDGGQTWIQTRQGPVQSGFGWDIQFLDSSRGWISGPKSWLLSTEDGGLSWTQRNNGLAISSWSELEMVDPLYGYAVGYSGEIIRTRDGGRFWEAGLLQNPGGSFAPTVDLNAVSAVDREFVVAVGDLGVIYRSEDGGDSWTYLGNPAVPEAYIYDVDFVDRQHGWVGGQNGFTFQGFLYRTTDGGLSWSHADPGVGVVYAMDFLDSRTGWFVGGSEYAWKTMDGGSTWIPYDVPPTPGTPNTSVAFAPDNHDVGWVMAAAFGQVVKTADGGVTWSHQTLPGLPSREFVQDIHVQDQDHAWIATSPDGLVYATDDGGLNWSQVPTGHSAFYGLGLTSITAVDGGRIWTTGSSALILASDPVEPGEIFLTQSELRRGQSATFQTGNAFAGEAVHFLYSLSGAGAGPVVPQLGGLQLDLLNPIVDFGTVVADLSGTATHLATVPVNAPLAPVSAQSVLRRGAGGALSAKSKPLTRTIQP